MPWHVATLSGRKKDQGGEGKKIKKEEVRDDGISISFVGA